MLAQGITDLKVTESNDMIVRRADTKGEASSTTSLTGNNTNMLSLQIVVKTQISNFKQCVKV